MIEVPKYITDQDIECFINLGVGVNPYGTGPVALQVRGQRINRLLWMSHGKPVILSFPSEVQEVHAYPTRDMKYMVVLLTARQGQNSQNAIFYDETGEEIFRPSLPKLKTWDEKTIRGSHFYFGHVGWSDRKYFLEFWVERVSDDFFEIRYFNYKTFQWDEENWMRQRY